LLANASKAQSQGGAAELLLITQAVITQHHFPYRDSIYLMRGTNIIFCSSAGQVHQ
jgi:hypothetical protein